MLGLGSGAGGGRALRAGGRSPQCTDCGRWLRTVGGEAAVGPAGLGAALPTRGAALCHLVLVVLLRGKERWGDDRGDSSSGTQRSHPPLAPDPLSAFPGVACALSGWKKSGLFAGTVGDVLLPSERPGGTEVVGVLVLCEKGSLATSPSPDLLEEHANVSALL